MLLDEVFAAVAGCQIERSLVAHFAGQIELTHQRLQAVHGLVTGAIGARGARKAVKAGQFVQRAIDFP